MVIAVRGKKKKEQAKKGPDQGRAAALCLMLLMYSQQHSLISRTPVNSCEGNFSHTTKQGVCSLVVYFKLNSFVGKG